MLFLRFSISFVSRKSEILIYDESASGTLLSHPQHAQYQMRSESSLNFSVNSEIFNSSLPLPQALFSVDVGLISKSGLKSFNIRPLRKPSRTQNTLNCILLLPKKALIIAIFLYHAWSQYPYPFCSLDTLFLCAYLVLCSLCNPQQGEREKGMLRAKGSRYGLKGPSDS